MQSYKITTDSNTYTLDNASTYNDEIPQHYYINEIDISDKLYEYLKDCWEKRWLPKPIEAEFDYQNKSIMLKMFISNFVVATCSISITGMKVSIVNYNNPTDLNRVFSIKPVLEAGVSLEFNNDSDIVGVVLRRKRNE